jgi:putative ABC transport system permease protein
VDGPGFLYGAFLVFAASVLVSVSPVAAAIRGAIGRFDVRRSRLGARLRRLLVVGQISLALLLLVGAGLFLRSLSQLLAVDLGFNPAGMAIATVNLMSGGDASNTTHAFSIFDRISERAYALPGVESVGFGAPPLIAGRGADVTEGADVVWFGRFPSGSGRDSSVRRIWVKFVDKNYLTTFRIPLVAGRNLSTSDGGAAPAAALLNVSAARLFFPNSPAIGHTFPSGQRGVSRERPLTVVGIYQNAHQRDVTTASEPEMLVPYAQQETGIPLASISVRSVGDPEALVDALRQIISEVDPNLPIVRLATMQSIVDTSLARDRFLLTLLSTFAGLAVVLASLGLYAVVAYVATERTAELGVRLALGAQRSQILGLVAGEGMRLVGIGIIIGLLAAMAFGRVVSMFLYEVQANDTSTLILAPALLTVIALIAACIPAHRASRVDPMSVLRHE